MSNEQEMDLDSPPTLRHRVPFGTAPVLGLMEQRPVPSEIEQPTYSFFLVA